MLGKSLSLLLAHSGTHSSPNGLRAQRSPCLGAGRGCGPGETLPTHLLPPILSLPGSPQH